MEDKIILKGNTKLLKPVITEIMALHQIIASKDIGTVLVTQKGTPPVTRRGKPKIVLFFLQDSNFTRTGTRSTKPRGARLTEGVISFRLMNENEATFTEANQRTIANRIKDIFGANNGYVWAKGKDLYAYTHWEMGYQFELLTKTESEARRIITSVMSIQSHTPNWAFLTKSNAVVEELRYPVVPPAEIIAGKSVVPQESRPKVDVRFRYAYAELDGLKEPIELYDRTRKLSKALVS